MAAERQKPAQLDWRTPWWGWALTAFALGGPLNPVALGFVVLAFAVQVSAGAIATGYLLMAGAGCMTMLVAGATWLARIPSFKRTGQALAFCVVAIATGLGIAAAITLPAAASLDERINLALAVSMLSLLVGGLIAASSAVVFRRVALGPKKPPSSRSRIVQPREIGSA